MSRTCTEANLLREIIGDELYSEVTKQLGGARFYIPVDTTERDRGIVEKFYAGKTSNELAIEYHLSFHSIDLIVRKHRQKPPKTNP
jgi:Mor family transcriptional regulator